MRCASLLLASLWLQPDVPVQLRRDSVIESPAAPGQVRSFTLALRQGESADIFVMQKGIDLVVDVVGPSGELLDSVDSPNGRQGDEPVAVVADRAGVYTLRVRALSPNEPAGQFTLRVTTVRNRAATQRLARERERARDEAARWLAARSSMIADPGDPIADLAPFDRLARDARIIGLGEATHGSREFGDVRLALIRRLVERHGYRLITLEDSMSRWLALAPYVAGDTAQPAVPLEWGWMGRRSRRELLEWVRAWNLGHPADRIRIAGVDPQDNPGRLDRLGRFIANAYGEQVAAAWAPVAAEIAAAEEQNAVFGDSGITPEIRAAVLEVRARLENDAELLRARFAPAAVEDALVTSRNFAQFVDFNGNGGLLSHSRDWHMAANILANMAQAGQSKAVYWGHNAHVSAAANRWGPTGAVLRQAIGCGYRGVALTFGEGSFIAQIPNDPQDRLAKATLPPPGPETIENVLASIGPGTRVAAWDCGLQPGAVPSWLGEPRPLRWVGGLYDPGTAPASASRPFPLTTAFDGIVYLPRVTAETIPSDRPFVPARRRGNGVLDPR